jgi:predicted ATPase/class 3 adenylate cyclase
VHGQSVVTTYLFTDVEGSTRLWEQDPERMREALARHDALTRAAVHNNRGVLVKMSGDGAHAAFEDPLDALAATLELQRLLADPTATDGVQLRVRCGLHVGVAERRENDFFGPAVNRAARIMSVAHGGQVLLSEAVAALVRERLPAGVALRDLGAVRLRDLSNVEHVYQVLHAGLRQDFPALRSLEATPNNLPQQLTSFIGREHELSEIRKLLRETRLLTLLGLGGIGKTRLSLHAAAEAMVDYPDGVWFVELAPLADGRLVPQAVASVLGVREEAGRPVLEALLKYAKDRRLLLILDNCEHLVHACAELATQLLQSGPHLKVLASSRESLRVAGEAVFPVPALAVPDPYQKFKHTALEQYAAARLFIDRTVAAQPAFEVTASNATAVAEICRRLDGIPLAIELAAARVRALSVEQIAARLEDRFRLLTSGNRAALPRQQTLRALIDWSYDLLSETERTLFRRVAVFAGGWTLEAAEAVGAGGDLDASQVLDTLADLVDKSLVSVEADSARYRLLETVRQYAATRLAQSGEGDATRARHLAFFLTYTENIAPDLLGPAQGSALGRFDLERENILSAHAWCLRNEPFAEQDYRLVHAIKHYWFTRGLLNLGHRVTVEAVTSSVGQANSLPRCRALWVAGQICCAMGRYKEAPSYLLESLQTARILGDVPMIVSALNALTLAALGQGDRATALVHCREALHLANQLGNKRQIATASNALAQIYRLEGKLEAAEPLYEQTAVLGRELGDRDMAAVGFLNLAMVAIERGAATRARSLLGEVLTIAEQSGSKPAGQSALEVSAGLAALAEDWERAARFYGMAERQAGNTGIQMDPADDAFLRPLMSKTRRALGDARFASSHASGRALNFEEVMAEARAWLAGGS